MENVDIFKPTCNHLAVDKFKKFKLSLLKTVGQVTHLVSAVHTEITKLQSVVDKTKNRMAKLEKEIGTEIARLLLCMS